MHARILVIFIFISLSNCATLRNQEPLPDLNIYKRISLLEDIKDWSLSGKISVKNKNTSGTANLRWQQSNDKFKISIIAPIGAKKIFIKGTSESIKYKSSDGTNISSNNPHETIKEELGWDFPLSNIQYWILGVPAPDSPFEWKKNALEYSFKQDGWEISFEINLKEPTSKALPETIVIENKYAIIKISTKSWKLN